MAKKEPVILAGGTETILLVDDDDMMRSFGKTLLEHLGYTVLIAGDGVEGLEIFRREFPAIQLVILDMVLPLLSGADVLTAIRSIDPEARVIMTSGYDAETVLKKVSNSKSVHFMSKPCDIHVLAQMVREALDETW
jgi:two-component system, cell cycle sensor histidine kinase and response regulator CckA